MNDYRHRPGSSAKPEKSSRAGGVLGGNRNRSEAVLELIVPALIRFPLKKTKAGYPNHLCVWLRNIKPSKYESSKINRMKVEHAVKKLPAWKIAEFIDRLEDRRVKKQNENTQEGAKATAGFNVGLPGLGGISGVWRA